MDTSPLLKVTLTRNISDGLEDKPLSMTVCIKLLQKISENMDMRPLLINHFLLKHIQSIYEDLCLKQEATLKDKERYEKTKPQKTPILQENIVFFPHSWHKKSKLNSFSPYHEWNLKNQKRIEITIESYAKITCTTSLNNDIGLYVKGFKNSKNLDQKLSKLAHCIHECKAAYSEAVVIINTKTIQDYQTLACYLYAWQKIQATLAEKVSETATEFSVILKEDNSVLEPSSESINETVNTILENDPSLKSLYLENKQIAFKPVTLS